MRGAGEPLFFHACKYKGKGQNFYKASLTEEKEFKVVGKDNWVFSSHLYTVQLF